MQHAEMDSVGTEARASLLSVRARSYYKIWEIPPCSDGKEGEPKVRALICGDIACAEWSPDASYFALNSSTDGLILCQLEKSSKESDSCTKFRLGLPAHLQNLPPKQLKWMSFSPQGTYLITYYHASGHGLVDIYGPNYLVWFVERGEDSRIKSAQVVLAERYRNIMAPGPLQWRSDESVRVLTSGGRVTVLKGHDFSAEPLVSFGFPGRFQVSIAPPRDEGEIILSVFSPASENSKGPAELRLIFIDRSPKGGILSACTSRCEFIGVDGCDLLWSPSVQRCLIMTSTLVDEAGENYGSLGDLWLCQVQATKAAAVQFPLTLNPNDHLVQTSKNYNNAPRLNAIKINRRLTQDASWSPVRDEFIVIEGKSPSDVYAMDGAEGKVSFTFPRGYRNKVLWNANGDMVAIGGFGNLAGDLSFYYRTKATEMTLISEIREGCTVLCGWSPCANFFFTASVRPRMNVDNQIKIWSRHGTKLFHIPFEELYDVAWRNDSHKLYPQLEAPQASAAAVQKSTYRPKTSSANKDEQMQLVDRFLKGELKDTDLPEDLRRSTVIMSRRNAAHNSRQTAYDKVRHEKKAVDLPANWRTAPQSNEASFSEAPTLSIELPRSSPQSNTVSTQLSEKTKSSKFKDESTAPPIIEKDASLTAAAKDELTANRSEDATLMSLLQSILPSSAKVHLGEDTNSPPPAFPQARHKPPPTSTAGEQERFMQIMRQAGMLIPPPTRTRPQQDQAPTLHQSAIAARGGGRQHVHSTPPRPPYDPLPASGSDTHLWQYVDPKGIMQGPFTRKQMRAWWEKGYFSGNLLVRREGGGQFRPLREVFPDASGVFLIGADV